MLIYYFLKEVKDRCFAVCTLSSNALFMLEFVFLPATCILLSIFYIFINRRFSPYQLAIGSYLVIFVFTILFFFLVLPNNILFNYCSISKESAFVEIIKNWRLTLLFLFTYLWTPISFMLFYGYINEKFSLEDATKVYPVFGIFAIVLSQMIINQFFPLGQKITTTHLIYLTGLATLLLLSLNIILFRLVEYISPTSKSKKIFPKIYLLIILALGFLNVSIEFSKFLSLIFTKSAQNAQDGLCNQYSIKNSFSFFKSISIFIAVTTLLFLRMYIQEHLTKGWKHFFYGVAFISTITSTALILSSFSDILFNESLIGEYGTSIHKRIVHIGANYQLFINIVSYPIFICLFQIILTRIHPSIKFVTQVIISLLLHKIGYFLSLLFKYTAYSIENMTLTFWIFLFTVFIIISLGRLFCIHYISKKIDSQALIE